MRLFSMQRLNVRLTFKLAVRHRALLQTAAAPDRLKGLNSALAQRFLPEFLYSVCEYSQRRRANDCYSLMVNGRGRN